MSKNDTQKISVSIIIPLYNEQSLIISLLDTLRQVKYPGFVTHIEIIIVDDASTDDSFAVVEEYVKKNSGMKLLQHSVNKGKGAAVKTGAAVASGDYILLQDADLELSPKDIPSLLNAANDLSVPFVNGSRYLPGVIRTQAAFKRYFANKLFTLITSILTNVHLTDMACGYKLISLKFFNQLHLNENRFGFEAELIIKCARIQKNWIAEVPVNYFPRNLGEGKKLKNMDGFRIFRTIIKYGLFKAK
ncbi:MAG: glycosyltransferase family 2 protein [Vicingus serpentipes]|nr:glycosyltransferase family 2 protein [Vicingus serpentipes]